MILVYIIGRNFLKIILKKSLTFEGAFAILSNVVARDRRRQAILENDIVKTDKQEQLAKTAGIRKDSGESE